MNINNFIVGEEDDEIYLIDFEDAVEPKKIENASELIDRIPTGGIKLNKKYIKTQLENSVKVRKRYRIDNPSSKSSDTSSSSSPRKTTKKKKSKSPSGSPRGKTEKKNSPKSPKT